MSSFYSPHTGWEPTGFKSSKEMAMSDVQSTISERGKTHGDFAKQGACAQELKAIVRGAKNWGKLAGWQQEAIEMICSKISRVMWGDSKNIDSFRDIAGYATLVENLLVHGKSHLVMVFTFAAGSLLAAPMELVEIQKETHARVIAPNDWYAHSFRAAKKGEVIWGNCSDHAATAMARLKEAGYTSAHYVWCDGARHVFTAVEGWAFDAKFRDRLVPVSEALKNCEGR